MKPKCDWCDRRNSAEFNVTPGWAKRTYHLCQRCHGRYWELEGSRRLFESRRKGSLAGQAIARAVLDTAHDDNAS